MCPCPYSVGSLSEERLRIKILAVFSALRLILLDCLLDNCRLDSKQTIHGLEAQDWGIPTVACLFSHADRYRVRLAFVYGAEENTAEMVGYRERLNLLVRFGKSLGQAVAIQATDASTVPSILEKRSLKKYTFVLFSFMSSAPKLCLATRSRLQLTTSWRIRLGSMELSNRPTYIHSVGSTST